MPSNGHLRPQPFGSNHPRPKLLCNREMRGSTKVPLPLVALAPYMPLVSLQESTPRLPPALETVKKNL